MGIMAPAAGNFRGMGTPGIFHRHIGMTVTARRRPGDRLDRGMCGGNGIMAGNAAEPGMGGMSEFQRVYVDSGADSLIIAMAFDASGILAHSVTECIRHS
jgi:hypothetical protein